MKASRPALFALLSLLMLSVGGCATESVSAGGGPSFRYGTAGSGCGNFFIYTEDVARTEALVVSGNTDTLALTTTPRTFRIEERSRSLDIHIDFFRSSDNSNRYCSDIGGAEPPFSRWQAVRGEVELSVSEENVPFNMPYRITVRLVNVEFRSPQGDRSATLPALTLENVMVGWLPG